jgi:hypothetical protein
MTKPTDDECIARLRAAAVSLADEGASLYDIVTAFLDVAVDMAAEDSRYAQAQLDIVANAFSAGEGLARFRKEQEAPGGKRPRNAKTAASLVGQLKAIRAELARCDDLPAREGIHVAWFALVKAANLFPGTTEPDRLFALLDHLPETRVKAILRSDSVNEILSLPPSLVSRIAAPGEKLDREHIAEEIDFIQGKRDNEPKDALRCLLYILRRVRKRRVGGVEPPDDPLNRYILDPTADILQTIGVQAVDVLIAQQ